MGDALDFSTHADYLVALLPETVLAIGAMTVLLVDVFRRGSGDRPSGSWTGPASILCVLAAMLANAGLLTVEVGSGSAAVAVDEFRIVSNFILLGATLLTILFAGDYLEREGLSTGEFYALLLLASVGMMVLIAARDLVLLFVGLELMSIAVYVLTGFDRANPRSSEAALKYFLIGAFASAFLLYGIALLYGVAGSTNLSAVAGKIAQAASDGDLLLRAGIALLIVGFGFKIAAVPFHMWAPDAYEGAPTPVAGYMATGVKAAAFVALMRLLTVDLASAAPLWQAPLWALAMLTMVVPNLIALAQTSVKRMLAYSSVAHAGYLLVGVVASSALGRGASLFYLAAYTLMTAGAFAVVYRVAGKGDAQDRLSDFRGLGWRRPALGAALMVFLFSLAGFPPTAGFVGKLYLLRAAIDAGQVGLAVTLVMTSLVAYYYYLRVVWKMYFEEAAADVPEPSPAGRSFRLATAVCAGGLLLGGLFPGAAVTGIERAGARIGPPAAAPISTDEPAGDPAGDTGTIEEDGR